MMWLRKHWFIIGLVGVIVISLLWPRIGNAISLGGVTADVIIVLLFLITGLTLPSETILSRLANMKFHVYIQSFIFLFIPLFVALTAPLLGGLIDEWTLIGLYATAVMPTTLTSNIIFTQASGGNVVVTTFNAALGNILGVFVSPLLLSLLLQTTGRIMPLEELLGVLKSLALLMLLPIAVGQIARRFLLSFINRYGKTLRKSTSAFILLIVLMVVSKAVGSGYFNFESRSLYVSFIYLALSHLLFLAVVEGSTRLFRFPREDRISALFTGTQKTLAMSIPMLTIFFEDKPELLAASIVPLSFYQIWQLIVAGFVRESLVRKK